MADLGKEELNEVERLAEPASTEAEILNGNEGREEALCDKMKETKVTDGKEEAKTGDKEEEKKEEPPLPKLSAADFRVYNSMAEHMEYFVRPLLCLLPQKEVNNI